MNMENVLSRVYEIYQTPKLDYDLKMRLGHLADDIQKQIAKDFAKAKGKGSAASTLTRILKEAKTLHVKAPNKEIYEKYEYAQTIKTDEYDSTPGMQFFSNGYVAFALKEHLPFPPVPENLVFDIQHSRNVETLFGHTNQELEPPTIAELKERIAIHRAKTHKRDVPMYDFGNGLPGVNAQYLIDLLTVLPDAKLYVKEAQGLGKVHVVGESSEGKCCILGIRKKQ